MFLEVYYKNYKENCMGAYWKEERVLPYMVHIRDFKERESFKNYLINNGYKCVEWDDSYPVVLINIEFKKFALIRHADSHNCVGDRIYSKSEFLSEVLNSELTQ